MYCIREEKKYFSSTLLQLNKTLSKQKRELKNGQLADNQRWGGQRTTLTAKEHQKEYVKRLAVQKNFYLCVEHNTNKLL